MRKRLTLLIIIVLIVISGYSIFVSKTNHHNAETYIESNTYFFGNITQVNCSMKFLGDDIIEKDVKLNIYELANLKKGKLYELKLDPIENVPSERLSLGYFYVQEDKIYKIVPTEENLRKIKTSEELPSDSIIVCQDKEIKDVLGKDEQGYHQYMVINGEKREYHAYNNQVSTGYYESFTWEKEKGLINYRSGYGAERDSIELQVLY
ncbi:hypothetical protein [Anaerosporobacter faecicola]|uniref:hypothetical protein n=1 Tax=Anaerosporobacter faecicola TaxID=2718714 RepID=UPI00143C84A6|nr:hypothetical protein [Anaerosporobacter faecicola]